MQPSAVKSEIAGMGQGVAMLRPFWTTAFGSPSRHDAPEFARKPAGLLPTPTFVLVITGHEDSSGWNSEKLGAEFSRLEGPVRLAPVFDHPVRPGGSAYVDRNQRRDPSRPTAVSLPVRNASVSMPIRLCRSSGEPTGVCP